MAFLASSHSDASPTPLAPKKAKRSLGAFASLEKPPKTTPAQSPRDRLSKEITQLSFIYPERGGFSEIFPEVMIFPEGNIITEGNISLNPPSGGSINDILYQKSKTSVRVNF